ncbi:MAG: MBL fold metallo-hydrolase [Actinobacteria bacterium]|nr:MBL fold metallo-hydrolase [Actinomycetota bacterium]
MTDASATFTTEPPLVHDKPQVISPLVRRITAANPSHMTGPGTNTYLVGNDEVLVIDPGPEDDVHTKAILKAAKGRIRWIMCTHTHPDHSPGVPALKAETGAEVMAWSNRGGLRTDRRLSDGDQLVTDEFTMTAVHTPGHAGNHLCFFLEDERMLFSGDHIMQGSTVVITPPDGDMGAYLESLAKVRALNLKAIAPAHGHVITDPNAVIDWYVTHRLEREAQLHGLLLEMGSARIAQLVEAAYVPLDPVLIPMAKRSVHAHLRKLADEGKVEGNGARGVWSVV